MKQKIIKKTKTKNGSNIYTIFDSFTEYFTMHLILGILLFPIWIIFIILKYFCIFFKWVVSKLSTFIQNKNKNANTKTANIISIVIIILFLGIIGMFIPSKNEVNTGTLPIEEIHVNDILKDTNYSIDDFVNNFNQISNIQIQDIEKFDIKNTKSEHYRVEYRLFLDSQAVLGKYNYSNIDIIFTPNNFGNRIRIYLDNSNIEDMKSFTATFLKIVNLENSKDLIFEKIDSQDLSFAEGKITGFANKDKFMINVE